MGVFNSLWVGRAVLCGATGMMCISMMFSFLVMIIIIVIFTLFSSLGAPCKAHGHGSNSPLYFVLRKSCDTLLEINRAGSLILQGNACLWLAPGHALCWVGELTQKVAG